MAPMGKETCIAEHPFLYKSFPCRNNGTFDVEPCMSLAVAGLDKNLCEQRISQKEVSDGTNVLIQCQLKNIYTLSGVYTVAHASAEEPDSLIRDLTIAYD